ncbi:unnamed protein product [Gordionus sp. m RMFG-2023]
MDGFRSLEENEEVEFESHNTDKGIEATVVTGPNGQNCKGSLRRPTPKRRFQRIKCYNCGRFSDHIAVKCPFPPPLTAPHEEIHLKASSPVKLCYQCKSDQHLIKDCPNITSAPTSSTPTKNAATGGKFQKKQTNKLTNGNASANTSPRDVPSQEIEDLHQANDSEIILMTSSLTIEVKDNGSNQEE